MQRRILCNIDHASIDGPSPWNGWSVHFIDCDGKTRIGPWLLLDLEAELDAILQWGNCEDWDDHRQAMRSWNRNSVALQLTDVQREALIRRGRSWPWNGYQLLQLREQGAYPPAPIELNRLSRQR